MMKAVNDTKVKVGDLPNCDFCLMDGKEVKAKYDAKVNYIWWGGTAWGNLCQKHFDLFKCKLGLGYGQELILDRG